MQPDPSAASTSVGPECGCKPAGPTSSAATTESRDGRLVQEGENLDGRTLVAAHGHRHWKAERVESGPLRAGFARADVVYALSPQGGDTHGFGGVKRIIRTENALLAWGWRVVA